MASVRERRPGVWEVRVYTGRDPLTRKDVYEYGTVYTDPGDEAKAGRKAAVIEDGILEGRVTASEADTFGELLDAWVAVARWSPSTRKQTLSMIARYLDGLRPVRFPIRTHTLDAFLVALEQRGGRCQHRPCRRQPCTTHGSYCRKPTCVRKPCKPHTGRCRDWVPCDRSPCDHGAPLAPATVKRVHGIVSAALQQAVVWDWIATNPAVNCRLTEIDAEETPAPVLTDVVALLVASEAVDPKLAVYELVSASSGGRRGAVHAWRLCDVDLDTGAFDFPLVCVDGPDGWQVIKATRKKRSGRGTLDPYTLAAVNGHVARLRAAALMLGTALPADAFLFSDDPAGATRHKPAGCWKPEHTTKRVRKIREANGLAHVQLKGLRNFMPTQLLDARISPSVVAERGGWKKVSTMLDIYARSTRRGDQDAADAMGKILAGAFGLGT